MRAIALGGRTLTPGKVVCVGRNFPEHAREMGDDRPPSEPILFLKPNSAIVANPSEIEIPAEFGLLHHEVELCAVLGHGGRSLSEAAAAAAIAGFAVGIDFTLRERQAAAKKDGGPWSLAKGFDASAVFGAFVEVAFVGEPADWPIALSCNGKELQRGRTSEMIFPPAAIIAFASRFMTLDPGDAFMFGTPSGVGAVNDGDRIEAAIGRLPGLSIVVHRGGREEGR